MAFWRSAVITPATRRAMNLAFQQFAFLYGDIQYWEENGQGAISHSADLANLFSAGNIETGELTPIGTGTVRRWLGFQGSSSNKIIPSFLDGHRPLLLYSDVQRDATNEVAIVKDGIGRRLNFAEITNLRLRVYLACLTGYEHTATTADMPIGLSRVSNWHGNAYSLDFHYSRASEAINIFDAAIQGRPVLGGEAKHGGARGRGKLVEYGWHHAYLKFLGEQEEKPWLLHIDGYARARNVSTAAGDTPKTGNGGGGTSEPPTGSGGSDGLGGGLGGGGGGGGAGHGEGYEDTEPFTDEDGYELDGEDF